MADYDWTKPTPGGSSGTWGTELNGILDVIQAHPGIKVVADATARGAYVPLLGQLVLQADTGKLYKCTNTTGPVWVEVVPAEYGERGICFSINNVDLTPTQTVTLISPCDLVITEGKLRVDMAPTGSPLICDVHKNGETIFATQANRPKIVPIAGAIDYTVTTNAGEGDTVTINGEIFTAVLSGATENQFVVGADAIGTAANIATALNANGSISSAFTATVDDAEITLTEKVAGGGDTPSEATYTGTIVISTGTAITSSAPTSADISIPDDADIAKGDKLALIVDEIGSATGGKELGLTLFCKVVLP